MSQPPPPIDQPGKRSGARTALFVLLGVAAFGVATCGAVGLWLTQSEQGKEILGAATTAVELGEKGQTAPGTDELRGAGCDVAMALRFGDMSQLMGAMLDEEEIASMYEAVPADTLFVVCQPGAGAALSCDAVAGVFVDAVAPSAAFHVQVQGGEGACDGFYSPRGEPISEEQAADFGGPQ